MGPFVAVAAVVVLFAGLVTLFAWSDGLTFLAPKSAEGLRASADIFCVENCRVNGRCPMGDSNEPRENCPLWKYVDSDAPTIVRGKPIEALHV